MSDIKPEIIKIQDWDATGYGLQECQMFILFKQLEFLSCFEI